MTPASSFSRPLLYSSSHSIFSSFVRNLRPPHMISTPPFLTLSYTCEDYRATPGQVSYVKEANSLASWAKQTSHRRPQFLFSWQSHRAIDSASQNLATDRNQTSSWLGEVQAELTAYNESDFLGCLFVPHITRSSGAPRGNVIKTMHTRQKPRQFHGALRCVGEERERN